MNQKETDIRNKFFVLLRSGLWGSQPDEKLFDSQTDWEVLYKESKHQAILGIVLDGIDLLPAEIRPPRPLYLKWCAEVLGIEDDNKKLDSEIENLYELLRADGVEPILMKGQGIARNYRNPEHRSSGDIDIYVGKNDYDKVNALLSKDGKSKEVWSAKHMAFEWHDVIIENHRLLATMAAPRAQKNLTRLIKSWHGSDQCYKCRIGTTIVTMAPLDFDSVFLLLHSVSHLMSSGVGLRQICDWSLFLHNHREELDRETVIQYLKDLGLKNAARIFGALAVRYLGLPKEDLIIPFSEEDERVADLLLDDIMRVGNFGISGERSWKKPKNWFKARIFNFKNTLNRINRLRMIDPEGAAWLPFGNVMTFTRLQSWRVIHRFAPKYK